MDLSNITVTEVSAAFRVYSPSGRREQMTNRPTYGLTLCEGGRITYIQDGEEYVSDSHSVLILPKGGTYSIHRDEEGVFPLINFDCTESIGEKIAVFDIDDPSPLVRDFDKIKTLILQSGSRAKIFSLFYNILSKLESSHICAELAPAISYINQSYTDPNITNADIAAQCRISEVYFRKLFSQHLRISPKQYIIDLRIERAKQRLSEGVLKISAISEECGFASPYHFCRIFKQHTGLTPSQYSKSNKMAKI